MTAETRPARLFTLRLWQEEIDAGQDEWRGKVQALPEGEAYYFRGWQGLIGRLDVLLASGMSTSPINTQEAAMSIESTQATMMRYFNSEHGDVSMMAEDVVFTIMATGQEHRGREGVTGMLQYLYHIAFDATATTRAILFSEKTICWRSISSVSTSASSRAYRPRAKMYACHSAWCMTWQMIRSREDASTSRCRRCFSSSGCRRVEPDRLEQGDAA